MNNMVFNAAWPNGMLTDHQARRNPIEFVSLLSHQTINMTMTAWVCWSPPCKVGSNSTWTECLKKFYKYRVIRNAGGLLCDERGSWCWGFIVNTGKVNSFTAELWGLREGLRLLCEQG